MTHQPKTLFNPTSSVVEFMCGGRTYVFPPGHKELMEGFVAYHALKQENTGLVEYDGQDSTPNSLPLNDMPWRALISLGSKLGVFQPGMRREELIRAIKDGDETGTLQKSTD